MRDLAPALRAHPLFATASASTLAYLADGTTRRRLAPGELALEAGDPSASVYALIDGDVRVFHRSAQGGELLLKRLKAPALFGEIEVLTDIAYREYAAASTPAELLVIARATFLQALATDVGLANAVLRDVSRRFCITVDHERVLSFEGVRAHIAYALLARVTQSARLTRELAKPTVQVTQEELACELGVTRRAISKQMSRLQSEGLVQLEGRRYTLLDYGALRREAEAFELSLVYSCSGVIELEPGC